MTTSHETPPHRWLTVREAAAYLAVCEVTVRRKAHELQGRRVGTGPRARWRFRRDALDRYLEGNTDP